MTGEKESKGVPAPGLVDAGTSWLPSRMMNHVLDGVSATKVRRDVRKQKSAPKAVRPMTSIATALPSVAVHTPFSATTLAAMLPSISSDPIMLLWDTMVYVWDVTVYELVAVMAMFVREPY